MQPLVYTAEQGCPFGSPCTFVQQCDSPTTFFLFTGRRRRTANAEHRPRHKGGVQPTRMNSHASTPHSISDGTPTTNRGPPHYVRPESSTPERARPTSTTSAVGLKQHGLYTAQHTAQGLACNSIKSTTSSNPQAGPLSSVLHRPEHILQEAMPIGG